MSKFADDPRYASCSEQGRGELEIYLQWIEDANLEDTEYAYISYLMGRASIADARHPVSYTHLTLPTNREV